MPTDVVTPLEPGTATSLAQLATQYRTRYVEKRDGKSDATIWHLLARRAGVRTTDREMYVTDLGHQLAHGTRYAMRQYDPNSPEGSTILRMIDEAAGRHPAAPNHPGGRMPAYRIDGYRTGPDPLNREHGVDMVHTGVSPDQVRGLFLAATGSTEHRRVEAWTIHPDRDYPDGILVAHTDGGDRTMFDPRVFAAALDLPGSVSVHPRQPARIYARDDHTVAAIVMPVRHRAATWAD